MSTSDLYSHIIHLTCRSVQDLGLKEYAGVRVGDAGEEQPLGLHWTTRNYNLRNTGDALLDPVIKVKVKVSFIVNAAICTGHTED